MGIEIRERYIDPYTDFGFKELFGTELNKDLQERIFKRLFDQAEIAQFSPAERREYAESVKDYWDYYSTMKTAHKKGKEGGIEEGRAEGRAEERLQNARSLKANGVPIDVIAKSLQLTDEETDMIKD